jgi:hypothetical protein
MEIWKVVRKRYLMGTSLKRHPGNRLWSTIQRRILALYFRHHSKSSQPERKPSRSLTTNYSRGRTKRIWPRGACQIYIARLEFGVFYHIMPECPAFQHGDDQPSPKGFGATRWHPFSSPPLVGGDPKMPRGLPRGALLCRPIWTCCNVIKIGFEGTKIWH